MKAREHTAAMLGWWQEIAGIARIDLAVRRPGGEMIWHYHQPITTLPLSWLRAENARQADIYLRPARGSHWPLVFLDDVERGLARRISNKYDCTVVETSPAGGCHLWLHCRRPLAERQRYRAQRWLVKRTQADLASVSGEHLGRLAGMKNWKRHGNWVNVLAAPAQGRAWDPSTVPDLKLGDETTSRQLRARNRTHRSCRDLTPSGRDWAWVCSQLERGVDADDLTRRLVARARPRRDADATRYARHTVRRARQHVATKC